MSALILKLVACVTMLCDHLGYHLGSDWLRMIGRISLPIFAYMITVGYRKTSDPFRYLLRILAFALITEPIYDYCFFGKIDYGQANNVLFTLGLGLLAIILLDRMRYRFPLSALSLIPVGFICLIAERMKVDYGMWVVILIVLYYLFDGESIFCRVMMGGVTLAFAARYYLVHYAKTALFAVSGAAPWLSFLSDGAPAALSSWNRMQIWAAAAAVFILLYNSKPGIVIENKYIRRIYQYSFYAFYPLHMLIIAFIVR